VSAGRPAVASTDITPFPVAARLVPAQGSLEDLGQGRLELRPEAALVTCIGAPLTVSWREVAAVRAEDYELRYELSGGAAIELSRLGGRFEEAVAESLRLWRDEIAAVLFISEPTLHDAFECRYARADGREAAAEARLYDTRLALFPPDGLPIVVEYGDITGVMLDKESYAVAVDCGERLVVGKLGRRTEEIPDLLNGRVGGLHGAVQATVARIAPSVGALRLRELSRVFAAGGSLPEAVIPDLAPALYASLTASLPEDSEGPAYVDALRGLCGGGLRLGVRPSSEQPFASDKAVAIELTADEEGEAAATIWALAPLSEGDHVTAVAFEVLTEEDRATYVFRISPDAADEDLRHIERALLRIQYRREPVALKDSEAAGSEYALAIRRIPELQWLRERLLARVAHTSVEAWTKKLRKLVG